MTGTARYETLWDRVDRNRVKLGVFVAAFVVGTVASVMLAAAAIAAVALFGVALRDIEVAEAFPRLMRGAAVLGASAGALLAAALAVRGFTRSDRALLKRLGASRVPPGELLPVKHALKAISLAAGFEHAPQLYIIEDPRVNAFAVGRRRDRTVIGITRGFAEELRPGDQRAVFANLLARTRDGDVLVATLISALMGPVWRQRDRELRNPRDDSESLERISGATGSGSASGAAVLWFFIGIVWVILSELLLQAHHRQAMFAAEVADAEGMLLLKDPREMLRGLERVLLADNYVKTAGEVYSSLFYCWSGVGFAPEDDPELRRLARLREVLGPAGIDESRFIAADDELLFPPAPRLEEGAPGDVAGGAG